MKVLFLIHRYPPARGGSEYYVQEIARRLVRDGHEATIYTSNLLEIEGFWRRGRQRLSSGCAVEEGVTIHRFQARVLPLHGVFSRALGLVPWAPVGLTLAPPGLILPDLWQAVRARENFDLVHAGAYPSLMYLGAVAAQRSGAKLVEVPHMHPGIDGQLSQRHYFLSRRMIRLYGRADAVIAQTESERQVLLDVGVEGESVFVSGSGVNPEAGKGADGARFRRKYGIAPDAPIVSFVGHKTEGKGILDLLGAAPALMARWPDLIMALVGAPTPDFVRRYASLPGGVRDRVLDLHLVDEDKHDLLAASSALVLPSKDDSFGIVLLEAWLQGTPVIGARAGGIPEVVQEGKTGLLVPYGSTPAIVEAIAWLLEHPVEAAQMGARGREGTLERWTCEAVYQRVRRVYEHCLDS